MTNHWYLVTIYIKSKMYHLSYISKSKCIKEMSTAAVNIKNIPLCQTEIPSSVPKLQNQFPHLERLLWGDRERLLRLSLSRSRERERSLSLRLRSRSREVERERLLSIGKEEKNHISNKMWNFNRAYWHPHTYFFLHLHSLQRGNSNVCNRTTEYCSEFGLRR